MRVPSLLLAGVAALLALTPSSYALVTIDSVSATGIANAGGDSDAFSATALSGSPLNAIASDSNGLAGDALASATLTASLSQLAGGGDTTIEVAIGVYASALGSDLTGSPFSADAGVLATIGFTLDTGHWLTVAGDNYLDSLRSLADNQIIDLSTATQLKGGSYILSISDSASTLDSVSSFDGHLSLRLYTIPEPPSCVLYAMTLLSSASSRRP